MKATTDAVTSSQYIIFRFILALYLLIHFTGLLPYSADIFAIDGMLGIIKNPPPHEYFPNLLNYWNSPTHVSLFLGALIALSLSFALGSWPRSSALLLWYGWACLFNRNPLLATPGLPYIGWLLLICCACKNPRANPQNNSHWRLPAEAYWGGFSLMVIGYTISGVHKLSSPMWLEGKAVLNLIGDPISKPTFLANILVDLPWFLVSCLTYSVIAIELLFLPLCLIKALRLWVWLSALVIHIAILLTMGFIDLTASLIIIHLFTFDRRWIKPRHSADEAIIFFDGLCTLCNHSVDLILQEGQEENTMLASLQGSTAYSRGIDQENLTSILVWRKDKKILTESDAAIYIAETIGGLFGLITIGKMIPKPLRDIIYRLVAKHRYRIFGKEKTCRMPSPLERKRFLP